MKTKIAEALLAIKAVSLNVNNPYTWASGLKAPIYCDNRLTLGYPELRNLITQGFVKVIKADFPEVEVIIGTATAGIPHATLVSDRLALPLGYVRKAKKAHGKENLIEGIIVNKQKAIIIEDLISTGSSALKCAEALKASGLDVLGVIAIFTYGLESAAINFARSNLKLSTLTDYQTLISIALNKKYIDETELSKLKAWRESN